MKNFPSLHPYFITGFIDAEGCFNLYFRKDQRCQNGYQVQLSFKISVHEKDRPLLELIQSYFGVGTISKHGQDSVQYQVRSLGDLAILIDHFYKYPLITQKQADYKLFKLAVDLMNHKEHLKIEGLQKIIAIKGSMNLGLSEELRAAFPNVTLVQRPLVQLPEKIDPDWVAGFTCGEGCFMINIVKSSTHKMGERINLMFRITQHSRDAELMKSLEQYFGCGKYQEKSKGQASQSQVGVFIVANYSDITGKINPFFTKYPLHGVKSLDFADFKKAAELMEAKAHLTESGLEKIRLIKALRALG